MLGPVRLSATSKSALAQQAGWNFRGGTFSASTTAAYFCGVVLVEFIVNEGPIWMENYYWFSVFVLANSVILYVLTANVSRLRLKLKISVGDGGNRNMLYAIRAQCNGVEQVPIFALIVLALTFMQAPSTLLAVLVVTFTIARVLHAYGMLCKFFLGRRIGAAFTYLLQLLGIVALGYKMWV